jgi:hypothetical protein
MRNPRESIAHVSASEFAKNFGRWRDEAAAAGAVAVTSHGRVIGGYLSAAELAHYETLKRREREVLIVGELPDDVVAELKIARYGRAPE